MERNNIRNFEKQHQVIHWRSPNVLFAKSLRLVSAVQNTFSLLKPSYIRWRCEYCKFEHTNSLFITSSLWYIIPYIYKYFVQYIVLLYFLIPLQYCILTVYLNKYLNFVLIEDFFSTLFILTFLTLVACIIKIIILKSIFFMILNK